MSEIVVGRKRTATGVLIEVRAIADRKHATPEQLTEYVSTLIAASDIICDELRKRRLAMLGVAIAVENARAEAREPSELGRCPECGELDCDGGEQDCAAKRRRSADAPLQYPCGCSRAKVARGDCTIFDPSGNVRRVGA